MLNIDDLKDIKTKGELVSKMKLNKDFNYFYRGFGDIDLLHCADEFVKDSLVPYGEYEELIIVTQYKCIPFPQNCNENIDKIEVFYHNRKNTSIKWELTI